MKAKTALIIILFLLSVVGICQAAQETKESCPAKAEGAVPVIKYLWYGFDVLNIQRGMEGEIRVDVTATVQTKHIWYGIDLLDDHGVFLPSASITLGDTGFSAKHIRAYPLSDDLSNFRQSVYALFYTGAFLKGTPYATNFTTNYIYYGMPEVKKNKSDLQEIGNTFFWPAAFKLGDGCLTPSYYLGYLWASRSNANVKGCEGFIHVLGLGYDFEIADLWAEGKNQAFKLYGDLTYNDGFAGSAIKHSWSHATLGISTSFKKGNFTMTPSVNYQISMEDTVNDEDEFWCGLNTTYRF